uniref:AlNc14C6G884 protein n=1 Tax=Albugo laibachii Nc14 TaxID=890382 RepID=F0W1B5_9STRA|nr:AlNc14C6G884 [Albugo laibachii Nc14]|eukprot:CCA14842.1 AlNc14C6G884 [Albugo laibachii Nc14]
MACGGYARQQAHIFQKKRRGCAFDYASLHISAVEASDPLTELLWKCKSGKSTSEDMRSANRSSSKNAKTSLDALYRRRASKTQYKVEWTSTSYPEQFPTRCSILKI